MSGLMKRTGGRGGPDESAPPHSSSHSAPHSTSHSAPHSTSHSTPHSTTHSAPHSTTHSAPHSTSHSAPHSTSHSAPHSVAQVQQAATSMHSLAQAAAQPQIIGVSSSSGVGSVGSVGVGGMVGVGGGFARGSRPAAPVINYHLKAGVQYGAHKPPAPQPQQQPPQPPRLRVAHASPALGRQSPGAAGGVPGVAGGVPGAPGVVAGGPGAPVAQFQRLKVEDALSYLDQVKFKFSTQPQVYNDFLDIMKEFKSQTIDTPGVIKRVSNLFKGHPELIVGFNTFLPPGYKIEVQSNGQVSVSMPSPTGLGGVGVGVGAVGVASVGGVGVASVSSVGGGMLLGVTHSSQPQLLHLLPVQQPVGGAIVHNMTVSAPAANTLHHISQAHQQLEAASIHHGQGGGAGAGAHAAAAAGQPVEFNHAIEYVNKIKSRFSRQPDKYKRFLEILHAYQRGHRDVKEPQARQQTEQEVYSQVAKLFENQEDLLAEFGQFLPDAKAVTKPAQYALHAAHAPPHAAHARSPLSPPPPPPHAAQLEGERFAATSPPPGAPHTSPAHVPPPALPAHLAHTAHAPHVAHAAHAAPTANAPKHPTSVSVPAPPPQHHHLKRSPSFNSTTQIGAGAPPSKKPRCSSGTPPGAGGGAGGGAGAGAGALRDVSYAEAAKLATAQDYSFFDRVRKALRSQHVYDNFLRCLLMFTNEIISSSELMWLTGPILCRHPELQKWLQDFVGPASPSPPHTPTAPTPVPAPLHAHAPYAAGGVGGPALLGYARDRLGDGKLRYEPPHLRNERAQGDAAMDIDLTTCKRLGTSYCALPRDAAARRCSGRTPLCKEVLNDTWVSIPTWSEDSTFVTSRKTQYEEYIYRCEDERFELDVVIETNAATIRVLEGVQKKMSRMAAEDAAKYRLDDCLGGHSPTIHQRALRRIYGDKVAVDIIAGLKKNPVVAVPVVLRRLKAKEEEWREAQKGFNKQWREQNEKYYLKSLDHQGINFKQNDLKAMRSKSLFNEVEAAYAARRPAPHLVVDYQMQSRQEAIKILRDAAELLIHHARRQTGIQKAEKRRIKQLLRHLLPDLFAHPRQPLSDDERDDEDKEEAASPAPAAACAPQHAQHAQHAAKPDKHESSESDNASDKSGRNNKNDKENKPKNNNMESKESGGVKRSGSLEESLAVKPEPEEPEEDYKEYPANEARFVCTSSWYLFLRLHGVLCARLGAARRAAGALAQAEGGGGGAAAALRLRPCALPAEAAEPRHYYGALLQLVRAVLDGNTEPAAYEDAAREMLGIKAYPAYTLDKVVSIAVRQLQHCASEPWSVRAAELAARGMRAGAGYVRRAARFLRQDHTAFLVRVYGGDECKVTFELLEGGAEGRASPHRDTARLSPPAPPRARDALPAGVARVAAWSMYAERYAHPDAAPPAPAPAAHRHKPVFLRRNARRAGAAPCASAAPCPGPAPAPAPRRRKPARLHDQSECTLAGGLRLVARRAHVAYRAGSLAAARLSHPRLHAARRARFRAWLRRHLRPPHAPAPAAAAATAPA